MKEIVEGLERFKRRSVLEKSSSNLSQELWRWDSFMLES